jgi:hypothetical protein
MKRLLYVLAALFLTVGVAHASWNLRQKSDGTADFVDSRKVDGGPVASKIGTVHLTVSVPDVNVFATYGVTSPITNGKVSLVQFAIGRSSTSAQTIHMFVTTTATGAYGTKVTNGVSDFASVGGGGPGATWSFSPTGNNTIEKNRVLLIQVGGTANSVTVPGTFTITIDPR